MLLLDIQALMVLYASSIYDPNTMPGVMSMGMLGRYFASLKDRLEVADGAVSWTWNSLKGHLDQFSDPLVLRKQS